MTPASETEDLAKTLYELSNSLPMEWDSAEEYHRTVAAELERRGWRKATVTPEQIEAAAKAGHAVDAGSDLPYWSWDSSIPSRQKLYRDIARAAARAFGFTVDGAE